MCIDSGCANMFPTRLPKLNFNSFAVKAASEQPEILLEQQKTALDKLLKWFSPESDKQNDTAIVSMPVGTGKSGVIACLPYYLGSLGLEEPKDLSNSPNGKPLYSLERPVLVMAPDTLTTTRLVCQLSTLEGQDETFLVRRNIVPADRCDEILPKVKVFDSLDALGNQEAIQGCELVVVNSGTEGFKNSENLWDRRFPSDLFSLVIIAEAHKYIWWTWPSLVRKFRHHSKVVIFTATIKRGIYGSTVLNFNDLSEVTYYLSLEEAIDRGSVREIEHEYTNESADDLPKLRDQIFLEDEEEKKLNRYVKILEMVKECLDEKRKAYTQVPHMAIAFVADMIGADQLVDIWKVKYPELSDAVETYHSFQTKRERQRVLSRIKANELSLVILTGSHPLEFDHPPVSIATVTYDTKSLALYTWFVRQSLRVYRREGYIEDKALKANLIVHSYLGPREYGDKLKNNDLVAN